MENILTLRYSEHTIKQKNALIEKTIISTSEAIKIVNFSQISPYDLRQLFYLYDNFYFSGKLAGQLKISFSFSTKMTKVAGKTIFRKRSDQYEMRFSSTLLSLNFTEEGESRVVSGFTCYNRLEALMRIMEHEMLHVLEFKLFGESSCNKERFKLLAKNIFGHSEVRHRLKTPSYQPLPGYNFSPGDKVVFSTKNETKRGTIYRVNRRATVMVKDKKGHYRDKSGVKYEKYYVPLQRLKPDEPEQMSFSF